MNTKFTRHNTQISKSTHEGNQIVKFHYDSLQLRVFHRDGHVEAENGAEEEDGDAEADRAVVHEPAAVGLFGEQCTAGKLLG